jgi:hypothetical protein
MDIPGLPFAWDKYEVGSGIFGSADSIGDTVFIYDREVLRVLQQKCYGQNYR